jgi:hypothetical protein
MTISGGASCWSKLKKQTSRSAGMSSVKIYFLRLGISVGDLVDNMVHKSTPSNITSIKCTTHICMTKFRSRWFSSARMQQLRAWRQQGHQLPHSNVYFLQVHEAPNKHEFTMANL